MFAISLAVEKHAKGMINFRVANRSQSAGLKFNFCTNAKVFLRTDWTGMPRSFAVLTKFRKKYLMEEVAKYLFVGGYICSMGDGRQKIGRHEKKFGFR